MFTPFETGYARDVVCGLLKSAQGSGLDAAAYLNEHMLCGGKMFAQDREPLAAVEAGFTAWVAACIMDDIANGTGYESACKGYGDIYREVLAAVKLDLEKTQRRLFRKVPLYDKGELLTNAYTAMTYAETSIGLGDERPQISESDMEQFCIDRHDELCDEMCDLRIRLDEAIKRNSR